MDVLRRGSGIEKIALKGLDLSLVATGGGTEIIAHRLAAGHSWALVPEIDGSALEVVIVLAGQLRLPGQNAVLGPGDACTAHPVTEHTLFVAETDAEFLYVTSQPVFHLYSATVRKQMDLAREVEQKDGYTADHCDRVKRLAAAVGEEMGLSPQQMIQLNLGAFLHDIGKVRVPEGLLGKPGALAPDEWEVMKQHPIFGRELLQESGLPALAAAAPIVEQHHERWDGKGYPLGRRGTEILLPAAIVTVVDAYDAMTSDRPYRKGMAREVAARELWKCRGAQFRPDVVDAFLRIMDKIEA